MIKNLQKYETLVFIRVSRDLLQLLQTCLDFVVERFAVIARDTEAILHILHILHKYIYTCVYMRVCIIHDELFFILLWVCFLVVSVVFVVFFCIGWY